MSSKGYVLALHSKKHFDVLHMNFRSSKLIQQSFSRKILQGNFLEKDARQAGGKGLLPYTLRTESPVFDDRGLVKCREVAG
jgi:hypothetical protein